MKSDVVYLRHIHDALTRIRAYTKGGKSTFLSTAMIQDATIRNLEIVGEAAKSISAEFREAHPDIPLTRMAGIRDVLIHDYMGVDLEIVWDVVANRIGELEAVIARLLEESGA